MVTSPSGSSSDSSEQVGSTNLHFSSSSWCKSYMVVLGRQSSMVTNHLGLTDDDPGNQSCMVTDLLGLIGVWFKQHWCIEQTDKENGHYWIWARISVNGWRYIDAVLHITTMQIIGMQLELGWSILQFGRNVRTLP